MTPMNMNSNININTKAVDEEDADESYDILVSRNFFGLNLHLEKLSNASSFSWMLSTQLEPFAALNPDKKNDGNENPDEGGRLEIR